MTEAEEWQMDASRIRAVARRPGAVLADCRNCGGDGCSVEGGDCPACAGSGKQIITCPTCGGSGSSECGVDGFPCQNSPCGGHCETRCPECMA